MAANAEQEEIEIWWGGYSPRAILPEVFYSLLATCLIVLTAWDVSERQLLPLRLPRYLAEALIVLLWGVQVVRWLHRITARTYRLTTRRLFLLSEFRMPCIGIPLKDIRDIRVTRTAFDRWLRLGRLHLRVRDAEKPLRMEGVERPDQIAELLRQQLTRIRLEELERPGKKAN